MKHEVIVPSAGESITEVFVGTWRKQSGEMVAKDEILVELETQKATFELQSEYAGKLEVLKPDRDTVVKPGDIIAFIDDAATGDKPAPQPVVEQPNATQTQLAKSGGPVLSPAARKIASEQNVNPAQIQGTGKDGRITKEDVLQKPKVDIPILVAPTAPATATAHVTSYQLDTARGERKKPATRIRKQIAQNLVAAQHTAAILTTFNEIDMTSILKVRKEHKEAFKQKHGINLGIMGFFAKAVSRAMKEFPNVNATFTGEDVITRDFVDLSIAVSTDRGLVVPIIRDIHQMSIYEFEKRLFELAEKARAGKLSISDMSGGTFTITNGGVFGSLLSTPILNMPQSGILGLHKTQDRPMVIDGKVEVRPMMYVALSYDHRLIDGREAVLFLVAVKQALEQIDLIFDPIKDL